MFIKIIGYKNEFQDIVSNFDEQAVLSWWFYFLVLLWSWWAEFGWFAIEQLVHFSWNFLNVGQYLVYLESNINIKEDLVLRSTEIHIFLDH